ncbi:winged helix-turn-helix domain-containing protein [Dubosiella newyorkensis]|uniref:winged helix-turn-helix domain-containing protein n=1 Tax=Dubosiella newyorkensis TaxID=1862672 RepID=UPI00272D1E11|nr:winged helix-turn-helix domain-containing protein [Dubosiella newyorkensis]
MEKDHGLNILKYLIVPYRSDLAKEIFISLNLWQREHWTINTKPTWICIPGSDTYGMFYWIETADLIIRPQSKQVFKGKKELHLTPTTFRILHRLVACSAFTVTRDSLHTIYDHEIEENTLTQAISDLRKQLGEGPRGKQYIQTVKGVGYRWGYPVERIDEGVL